MMQYFIYIFMNNVFKKNAIILSISIDMTLMFNLLPWRTCLQMSQLKYNQNHCRNPRSVSNLQMRQTVSQWFNYAICNYKRISGVNLIKRDCLGTQGIYNRRNRTHKSKQATSNPLGFCEVVKYIRGKANPISPTCNQHQRARPPARVFSNCRI